MRNISFLVLLTALVVGNVACATDPVEFTPQNGFGGQSEGNGSLKLLFGKARHFHVDSYGTQERDGTFRLEQTVTFDGEPSKVRVWHLETIGPHRYSATLSDAAGLVTGTSEGARLSLRFRVKGPLVMHQELQLMPDGRTIDNTGTLTLFGLPVGHLHETIIRKGVPTSSNFSHMPMPLRGAA